MLIFDVDFQCCFLIIIFNVFSFSLFFVLLYFLQNILVFKLFFLLLFTFLICQQIFLLLSIIYSYYNIIFSLVFYFDCLYF